MTITDASIIAASDLTDTELSAVLGRLAQDERKSTVALIVHLAEFDARRLYEPAGFSSLFKYCRAVLRLSEDAVYNRIRAARAARRYPVIVDMLLSGALSPTTARLLARHLTPANHEVLLAAASGKGRDDVEELLAERFPRAEVTARVRKLRTPQAIAYPAPPAPPREPLIAPAAAASLVADPPPFMAPPSPSPTALVRPLAPERYEVRFTATREMRDRLRLAQDLLGHAVPSGDLAQVFDRALTALVADLSRTKFAATPAAPGEPRPGGGIVGTSPRRCGARCGREMARDARSFPSAAAAAASAGSSSSTTSSAFGWREADRREHPVAASASQRSRGRSVLRTGQALHARGRGLPGAGCVRSRAAIGALVPGRVLVPDRTDWRTTDRSRRPRPDLTQRTRPGGRGRARGIAGRARRRPATIRDQARRGR